MAAGLRHHCSTMSQTERVYKIEMLIRHRGQVSFATLLEALEVSPATLKRDLEFLRSRLGAPIVYDRSVNGYHFADGYKGQPHELPGLWFNERELYSLLMAHQLLSELDTDGMLSRHLQPLLERIHRMLGTGHDEAQTLLRRVRIVGSAKRPVPSRYFELVGQALIERKRLRLHYLSRGRGERGQRDVSPQRLMHYRNTWYLDAWCHRVEGLRRFALDAVEQASLLDSRARNVAMKRVEEAMDAGYGVYADGQRQWAVLVFNAQAAQWVSRETWHAQQRFAWLADGRYQLELPYVDDTELVMDILRQGEQVQVMLPRTLRAAVQAKLRAAAAQYEGLAAVLSISND